MSLYFDNELQAAFAVSQVQHREWSDEEWQKAQEYPYSVITEHPAYCQYTDATLGVYKSVEKGFNNLTDAKQYISENSEKLYEDYGGEVFYSIFKKKT